MKEKLHKLIKRRKVDSAQYIEQAADEAPRITNETVAAHREEVLSSARKYILPLSQSKHQVVVITTTLFIASVVAFFTYCTLALYKFRTNSTFLYRVTQVIPFPVARAGNDFVAYENYLFELRRYTHYYENQQKTNFDDPGNKEQLQNFKQLALDKVLSDAYVKELAAQNNVTVSDKEVSSQIEVVRQQNRLGGSDKVFADVLKDYWGWSIDDFRRSLRMQMLAQKLVATLDTDTTAKAQAALAAVRAGADFGATAKQYSDDMDTKDRGGEFGYPIDRANRNINPQTTDELFKLQPGQVSEIISVGTGLEIVKSIEVNGDKIRAAHIFCKFKDIQTYIGDYQKTKPSQRYI